MNGWTVSCAGCGLHWDRAGHFSDYERQAVESRPCPGCGAYTLVCREPRRPERDRPTPRPTPPRRAA